MLSLYFRDLGLTSLVVSLLVIVDNLATADRAWVLFDLHAQSQAEYRFQEV